MAAPAVLARVRPALCVRRRALTSVDVLACCLLSKLNAITNRKEFTPAPGQREALLQAYTVLSLLMTKPACDSAPSTAPPKILC